LGAAYQKFPFDHWAWFHFKRKIGMGLAGLIQNGHGMGGRQSEHWLRDMDRLQDLYFREERAPLSIIAFFCPLSFVVERWMSRLFLLLVVWIVVWELLVEYIWIRKEKSEVEERRMVLDRAYSEWRWYPFYLYLFLSGAKHGVRSKRTNW
jgi:hypothetical protein